MDAAIGAALATTIGFAAGDTITALVARRVNGKVSMLLLTTIKLVLYVPLLFLWWNEFGALDGQSLLWIVLLGLVYTIAFLGFNLGMATGKDPALVGVVAGCFPASAAVVAIVFLGQPTTLATVLLLIATLVGVTLIGLPRNWHKSLRIDKGILLALLPMIGWGVFAALLNKPVQRLGTPHAWFVVQMTVVEVMVLCTAFLYNRHIPGMLRQATRKKAWGLALCAGGILAIAELFQAFALGSGKQIVIVVALIGSYPAVYFLLAHKIFKKPLHNRQWVGIGVVAVAIILLSTGVAD